MQVSFLDEAVCELQNSVLSNFMLLASCSKYITVEISEADVYRNALCLINTLILQINAVNL